LSSVTVVDKCLGIIENRVVTMMEVEVQLKALAEKHALVKRLWDELNEKCGEPERKRLFELHAMLMRKKEMIEKDYSREKYEKRASLYF